MEIISLKNIVIKAMVTALPENVINVEDKEIPTSLEKQTASDLAFEAAKHILSEKDIEEIGVLVFLTSTPDYRSPASAMVIQSRLGIGVNCIAFDINISGNGFGYGLQVVGSLLQNSSKSKGLLLLGDTPSKQHDSQNDNILFLGDGATAIYLEKVKDQKIFNFYNLTQSDGSAVISLANGGYRGSRSQGNAEPYSGLEKITSLNVDLNSFRSYELEMMIDALEKLNKKQKSNINLLFTNISSHDQNNCLIQKLDINEEKFVFLDKPFNLLGASIPFEMARIAEAQDLKEEKVASIAFGEGLSVSLAVFDLNFYKISKTIYSDKYFNNGEVTHQI